MPTTLPKSPEQICENEGLSSVAHHSSHVTALFMSTARHASSVAFDDEEKMTVAARQREGYAERDAGDQVAGASGYKC